MKYFDGKEICIGDKLIIEKDCDGTVVCVFDTEKFSNKFPKEEWGYLREGFLVSSPQMGLVHYPKITEEIKLIERIKK